MTTQVAWIAPVCAAIGICTAAYLGNWVIKQDPGPDKMHSISKKIQQGASAFLAAEYKMLAIFVIVVFIGATMDLALAWDIADTLNGLMAIPNLIGVLACSGTVVAVTKNYVDRVLRKKQIEPMYSALDHVQEMHKQEIRNGK